jgi:hypothetical protein
MVMMMMIMMMMMMGLTARTMMMMMMLTWLAVHGGRGDGLHGDRGAHRQAGHQGGLQQIRRGGTGTLAVMMI